MDEVDSISRKAAAAATPRYSTMLELLNQLDGFEASNKIR